MNMNGRVSAVSAKFGFGDVVGTLAEDCADSDLEFGGDETQTRRPWGTNPSPKLSARMVKPVLQQLRHDPPDTVVHVPPGLTGPDRQELSDFARIVGLKARCYVNAQGGVCMQFQLAAVSYQDGGAGEAALKAAYEKRVCLEKVELAHGQAVLAAHPVTEDDVLTLTQLNYKQTRAKGPLSGGSMHLAGAQAGIVPAVDPSQVTAFAAARASLPVTAMRAQIMQAINNNHVVLISGSTVWHKVYAPTGKSTQIPQFVLESACEQGAAVRVVVTQPRRLPAVTVAERIASERGEPLGDTVGFHIRLNKRTGPNTRLTVCTPGVLLRSIKKASAISHITHVFLDEVHERDLETDYLLTALKQLQSEQPVNQRLRLVLMSATIEADLHLFTRYFPSAVHLQVPGQMHDVDTFYLEDILPLLHMKADDFDTPGMAMTTEQDTVGRPSHPDDSWLDTLPPAFCSGVHSSLSIGKTARAQALMAKYRQSKQTRRGEACERTDIELAVKLIHHINRSKQDGAVLVFLTGYEDIMAMRSQLLNGHDAASVQGAPELQVLMLHSELDNRNQHEVFAAAGPGRRKIILSTNIAEASLTIDDVVFVVDCGQVKQKRFYHSTHISTLLPVAIAKSNAVQRKGRAGRCRPGWCFRLYSAEDFENMELAATPEIKRIAIHDISLHARIMADADESIAQFLAKCPEPPNMNAVQDSICYLKSLGALQGDESLTALGTMMSELPVDPQMTRTLFWALTLGCLEPVLVIVALMSYRDPFTLSSSERGGKELAGRESLAGMDMSDHIMYVRLWQRMKQNDMRNRRDKSEACRSFGVSMSSLDMASKIYDQLLGELCRLGVTTKMGDRWLESNRHSHCWPLIKACLVGGSYPSVAFISDTRKLTKIQTIRETEAELSPGCSLRMDAARIRRLAEQKEGNREFKFIRPKAESSDGRGAVQMPPSDVRWVMYQELIQLQTRVVLKGVTAVTGLCVCVFGGTSTLPLDYNKYAQLDQRTCVLTLADWLAIKLDIESLSLVHGLRVRLHAAFVRCAQNCGRISHRDQVLIEAVSELLIENDRVQQFVPVNDLARIQRAHGHYGPLPMTPRLPLPATQAPEPNANTPLTFEQYLAACAPSQPSAPIPHPSRVSASMRSQAQQMTRAPVRVGFGAPASVSAHEQSAAPPNTELHMHTSAPSRTGTHSQVNVGAASVLVPVMPAAAPVIQRSVVPAYAKPANDEAVPVPVRERNGARVASRVGTAPSARGRAGRIGVPVASTRQMDITPFACAQPNTVQTINALTTTNNAAGDARPMMNFHRAPASSQPTNTFGFGPAANCAQQFDVRRGASSAHVQSCMIGEGSPRARRPVMTTPAPTTMSMAQCPQMATPRQYGFGARANPPPSTVPSMRARFTAPLPSTLPL